MRLTHTVEKKLHFKVHSDTTLLQVHAYGVFMGVLTAYALYPPVILGGAYEVFMVLMPQ